MREEYIFSILLAPHISEKSAAMVEANRQYVFKVATTATKPQVKRAVEKMFHVNVDSVRLLNVRGKTRKVGAILGKRKAWRKAYVQLREGQKINFGEGA